MQSVTHHYPRDSPPPAFLLAAPPSGFWLLASGHWSLVIGHWSLVIGHWSLVIGHWSLVIGHWSLVIPGRPAGNLPHIYFTLI
ncbi:hypothetical protein CMV30_06815 [Nibricoccus aquaticus]|uniref:Uncharacterized protein n=1 Tax=Nibricoccus aquaticus TaxID=2576891 RepID=A0A290QBT2_9BACT|nr:hypothetical protein CMV30_06815 [Nibricoccus aquaticus]